MFDAKPNDRDHIALWVQEIVPDHRIGPDGVLIEDDKVSFGKKGAANYQMVYSVARLPKENPPVWEWFRPLYERWKADRKIVREGLPLDAWAACTSGQIKACNDLGLFTVEDIATATDSIRQKLGIGASDLITKAKAFIANKDAAAQAATIADLQRTVESQAQALREARETMDRLAAQVGKVPRKQKEAA